MRTVAGIFLVLIGLFFAQSAHATSLQAYTDYQYQYDVYRQRLSDYRIALTQYKQYNSLSSQQNAVDKVKVYIEQRDNVSKAYFLFLRERLGENPGLTSGEQAIYRALITNHMGYIDKNAELAPSIASLDDAKKVSEKYIDNYENMQSSYRQTIAAIELGYLQYFAQRLDDASAQAQALIVDARSDSVSQKVAVLDRWILSLTNKYTLFQQKTYAIRSAIPTITGNVQEQDRKFLQLRTTIGAARQDLLEAVAYLKEIETALKYE